MHTTTRLREMLRRPGIVVLKEQETDWHDGPVLGPLDIVNKVGFDWWNAVEKRFTRV